MYELAESHGCRQKNLVAYFDERIDPCGTSCDRCSGTSFTSLVTPLHAPKTAGQLPEADVELFQRLRALRRELADTENVPAYIVFSDAVLERMAAVRPRDEAGLLSIAGIGPAKLARYGSAFLRVLRAD